MSGASFCVKWPAQARLPRRRLARAAQTGLQTCVRREWRESAWYLPPQPCAAATPDRRVAPRSGPGGWWAAMRPPTRLRSTSMTYRSTGLVVGNGWRNWLICSSPATRLSTTCVPAVVVTLASSYAISHSVVPGMSPRTFPCIASAVHMDACRDRGGATGARKLRCPTCGAARWCRSRQSTFPSLQFAGRKSQYNWLHRNTQCDTRCSIHCNSGCWQAASSWPAHRIPLF
jgi:hypothetical protein